MIRAAILLTPLLAGCGLEALSGEKSESQKYYEARIASLEARISGMEAEAVATKVDVKPVDAPNPPCAGTFRISYCDEHGQEIFYE